jgi:hypothetical protein
MTVKLLRHFLNMTIKSKATNDQTKDMAAANSGFALWGLTHFVDTFVVKQTFLLRINNSAKNPPQPKAANR